MTCSSNMARSLTRHRDSMAVLFAFLNLFRTGLFLGPDLNSHAAIDLESTISPARALGMADTLGAIAVGREADLSILDVVEGQWEFVDSLGQRICGEKAIVPALTIRGGEEIMPDWGPHPWGWLPERPSLPFSMEKLA